MRVYEINSMIFLMMCLVSVMGIFEFILHIPMEENVFVWSVVVCFKSCINYGILVVNLYGRGVNWLTFCVNSFDN